MQELDTTLHPLIPLLIQWTPQSIIIVKWGSEGLFSIENYLTHYTSYNTDGHSGT